MSRPARTTDERLAAAGRRLGAELHAWSDQRRDLARARASLTTRRRPPRRHAGAVVRVASALVAATCAAAVWWWRAPAPGLTFSVDGDPGRTGVAVGSAAGPVKVDFSDGSAIEIRPGGHAVVADARAEGATLRLARGQALLAIRKRDGHRWAVHAGPFIVAVTGTRFEVGWDPQIAVLTVSLHEGQVRVLGDCLAAPRVLAPGDSVRLTCAPTIVAAAPSAGTDPHPYPLPPAGGRGQTRLSARDAASRPARRDPPVAREPVPSHADGAALRAEIDHLALVRRTLGVDPGRALALADEGHRAFSGSALWEEREAAAILALDRLGRAEEARLRGRRFLSRFPRGPFATKVREIVGRAEAPAP